MTGIRQKTYDILEGRNTPGKWVNISIMVVIVLNFITIIMETYENLGVTYAQFFFIFEVVSIGIFTVEYILRVWSCTAAEEYAHPFYGRLKFARNFFSVVDLVAIVPFYLSFMIPGLDLRSLRLFRLLRIFKLLRHFEATIILPTVIYNKRQELILACTAVLILLMISSTLIYLAENEAQPESFSSIPASMWWAITTLSTVGYGDMTPVTPFGRVLGGIISILGIGMFALPAGILAQGFDEAMKEARRKQRLARAAGVKSDEDSMPERCPYCGQHIDKKP